MAKSIAFGLAVLVVYLALLTRSHYWDGVLFSYYIEGVAHAQMARASLFHPNHLLYSAAGYVLYDMLSPIHLRAITCLQIGSAVCGAATAALIYHVLQVLTRSTRIAIVCAILFAFGATWWKFSTDAASYVPAVLLTTLAVRAALGGRLVEAFAYHVSAMLIHQLAIFAFLPVAFALYANGGRRKLFMYASLTVVATIAIYLAIFQGTEASSGRGFFDWLTSYSGEAKTARTAAIIFRDYPLSYLKLFLGGKLSLIRDFLSALVITSLVAAFISLFAGLWFLRKPELPTAQQPIADRIIRWTLLLWIAPFAIFLLWFEPGNAFYKLFLWPPAVLLAGIAVANSAWWRSRLKSLLFFSLAITAWNLGAFIYPHTKPESDPVYSLALKLNRELPPDAKIFYRTFSPDNWYLAYFAPGREWHVAPTGNLAPEAPLCLETSALGAADVNASGLRETRSWQLIDDKHHVRVACFVAR